MTDKIRIFFDFEFNPTLPYFIPISLGMVTEFRDEFYLEYEHVVEDLDPWVRKNVVPHLTGESYLRSPHLAKDEILKWFSYLRERHGKGKDIEFWGFCPEHDWVLMCQHWTFDTHPQGIPRHVYCLRQYAKFEHVTTYPKVEGLTKHNALDDCKWNLAYFRYIESLSGCDVE